MTCQNIYLSENARVVSCKSANIRKYNEKPICFVNTRFIKLRVDNQPKSPTFQNYTFTKLQVSFQNYKACSNQQK